MINVIRLLSTKANLKQYAKRYPQILLASCFTPFMFEGCKNNSIRIWKTGSVLNAFFIGCLPQIVLMAMDYYRGIVNWDFLASALVPEQIYENNDALFKCNNGNALFAIISGTFFLFLIIIAFFTDKIFISRENFCTCFSDQCLPCPSNFLHLDTETSPSPIVQINPNLPNDETESVLEMQDSAENESDPKEENSQMYVCSEEKRRYFRREPSLEESIELKKVTLRAYNSEIKFKIHKYPFH